MNASILTVAGVNGSTLTPALGVSATVTVLPVGAGPGQPFDNYAPLVIYGDTSQDGVWYGGDPHTLSLHNFGPKPMPHADSVTVSFPIRRPRPPGTITRNTTASPGSFLVDGFAVGNELANLSLARLRSSRTGAVDIFSNRPCCVAGTWSGTASSPACRSRSVGQTGTWTAYLRSRSRGAYASSAETGQR